MSVRYHVDDELLLSYAAGTLDEASGLLVATHLALCPHCRARNGLADTLGGQLLDDLPPAELTPGLMQSALTLARSERQAPRPAASPEPAKSDVIIPQPLRSYLGGDLDGLKWTRLAPRVQQIAIDIPGCKSRARMLRFQSGTRVPAHGHHGRELTLVLCGHLHDQDAVMARGDIADFDETTEHQPHAGAEQDCICLAVTDAPLRFKGVFARLMQPWFGI